MAAAGGEQVEVTGEGYAPGSAVPIYLVSPGLVNDEQQLGTVTADATGAIDSVVTIPLSATGFVESALGVGLGFLNAEGTGSQAAQLDDLAMIGVSPLGSTCGL